MKDKYSIDDLIEFEIISLHSDVFNDEQFPSEITSLIDFDEKKLSNSEKIKWTSYEWRSLIKTYKDFSLLNNVSCKDVIQGSLGNCYFLSVCAVMAEFPHRLNKIFLTKTINKAGIYAIQFFIDGEKKKIIIDDMIPFDNYSNKTAFTKFPTSHNIWTIIMEKSWAKFLGNYERTISGVPNDVFTILTGAPSLHYSTRKFKDDQTKSQKWLELCDYYLKDYLICCGSHSENFYEKYNDKHDVNYQLQEHIKTIEEIRELGLVTNHAYSVLLCHEEEIDGESVKLIKIRNPWGVLNHNKLRFDSILIKKSKYKAILYQLGQMNEGVFILTYEEFLRYFSDIYVCKYMDNYNVISRALSLSHNNYNHFFAFKVTLHENVENKIFFNAAKPTRLLFYNKDEVKHLNEIYSSIWLGNISNDNRLTYIKHNEGFDSLLTIELDYLSKGVYYVLIHMDDHQTNVIDRNMLGSFQIYTDNEQIISESIDLDESILLFSDLCHSFYNNLKKKNFDHKKYLTADKLIYSDSLAFPHSSYSFIIFENHKINEKIVIDVNIEISSIIGVESILLKEKSLCYKNLILNHNENFIIPFYKAGFTYKFSYRTYTFLNKNQLIEETRKSGQIYIINIDEKEIFYYFYKHKTGMVFRFTNISEVFLIIKLQITEIYNLSCSEEKSLKYDLYLEPEAEIYRLYELIDINEGFQLKWKISAEIQY